MKKNMSLEEKVKCLVDNKLVSFATKKDIDSCSEPINDIIQRVQLELILVFSNQSKNDISQLAASNCIENFILYNNEVTSSDMFELAIKRYKISITDIFTKEFENVLNSYGYKFIIDEFSNESCVGRLLFIG